MQKFSPAARELSMASLDILRQHFLRIKKYSIPTGASARKPMEIWKPASDTTPSERQSTWKGETSPGLYLFRSAESGEYIRRRIVSSDPFSHITTYNMILS